MKRGWLLAACVLASAGALGVGGSGGVAEAATVKVLSPGNLADRSTVVFIGTVAEQKSRFVAGPNHVVTETVFAVEQVIKGPDKRLARFALTQLGGTASDGTAPRTTAVPGYARFAEGERVMLFLEPTTTGRLVPTGLAQGKYTLSVDPKSGVTLAVRDLEGLHLVGAGPTRHLLGAPQDPNRLTLDQLLRIARGQRPVEPVRLRDLRTPQVDLPAPGEVAP